MATPVGSPATSGIDTGVTSSVATTGGNTLSDQNKSWAVDIHRNKLVRVLTEAGAGQQAQILGNSINVLVINGGWREDIPIGSVYVIIGTDFAQDLRDVFGGGADISAANPLQVEDPKVGSLISYEGVTTADGAAPGTTLIDALLIPLPDYDGNQVVITSGANIGQARDINGTTVAGVVTPHLAFDNQVVAGVHFTIVAIRTVPAELAALTAAVAVIDGYHDVPGADVADNAQMRDVIGDKTDTALQAVAANAALMRYVKGLITAIGDPTGDNLVTLATKWGDITRSLDLMLGARWDAAGDLGTDIAAIIASQGRILIPVDFWSEGDEEVQIGAAAGTDALPDVVVADLPAGATIVVAKLMLKFRMIENTYAGVNKLDGATVALTSQVIQVDDSGATGYVDGINFVDDFFTLADSAREGGDVVMGQVDVAARVDGNDTYSLRWLLADADQDFINFNDVQVGIRIWYSV